MFYAWLLCCTQVLSSPSFCSVCSPVLSPRFLMWYLLALARPARLAVYSWRRGCRTRASCHMVLVCMYIANANALICASVDLFYNVPKLSSRVLLECGGCRSPLRYQLTGVCHGSEVYSPPASALHFVTFTVLLTERVGHVQALGSVRVLGSLRHRSKGSKGDCPPPNPVTEARASTPKSVHTESGAPLCVPC